MKPLIERICEGPYSVYANRQKGYTVNAKHGFPVADIPVAEGLSLQDAEAHAEFVLEAFTVAHETGLTPRQMAERLKTLEPLRLLVDEHCNRMVNLVMTGDPDKSMDDILPLKPEPEPVLPAGLPPLPPGTRYAGQLKDHDGGVEGWIYNAEDPDGWEYSTALPWIGMEDDPTGDGADWHVAVPI